MKKIDEVIKNIAKGIVMKIHRRIREEMRIPLERRMRDAFPRHSYGWYDEKATRIIVAALRREDVKHPEARKIVAELTATFDEWDKMKRPSLRLQVGRVFPRMDRAKRDVIVERILGKTRKYVAEEEKGGRDE